MRFFRIYFQVRGGQTHTRWFSGGGGRLNSVMGKCGELTFVNDEWEAIKALLQHSTVRFIDVDTTSAGRTEAAGAVGSAKLK